MESFKYRGFQETLSEHQLVIHRIILNGKLCINMGQDRNLCIITQLSCPVKLVPAHIFSESEMREYYVS